MSARNRGDHDSRTGFGIGKRVMVAQRNTQMRAHVRQRRGTKLPDRAREPNRAPEGKVRRRDPRGFTAGVKDGPVEGGVVRCEEVRSDEALAKERRGGRIRKCARSTISPPATRTTATEQALSRP